MVQCDQLRDVVRNIICDDAMFELICNAHSAVVTAELIAHTCKLTKLQADGNAYENAVRVAHKAETKAVKALSQLL